MIKEHQELFYKEIGKRIANKIKENGTTISRVATSSGEQYNTVKSAVQGKPFYFHQAVWIEDLGIDIHKMIKEILKGIAKGSFNGEENKENGKQKSAEDFI